MLQKFKLLFPLFLQLYRSKKIRICHLIPLLVSVTLLTGCAPQVKNLKDEKLYNNSRDSKGFNHKIHAEAGAVCRSCHLKAYTNPEAGMPNEKLCEFCHQKVYRGKPIGEFYSMEKWYSTYQVNMVKYLELKMSHQQHINKGIKCEDCHGDIANSVKVSSRHIPIKGTCFSCHREWNTPQQCNICHKEITTFSHPELWGQPKHNHCLQCHIPISDSNKCKDCHNTASCVSTIAPSRPDDLPHRRPLMCRACHTGERQNLTHADNGIDCRICHKLLPL